VRHRLDEQGGEARRVVLAAQPLAHRREVGDEHRVRGADHVPREHVRGRRGVEVEHLGEVAVEELVVPGLLEQLGGEVQLEVHGEPRAAHRRGERGEGARDALLAAWKSAHRCSSCSA
jgi:hypothetical protein